MPDTLEFRELIHRVRSQDQEAAAELVRRYESAIRRVIRIRLRDLLPLVAMAQKNHFIWLKDFLDDEVGISDDLHDVLMAFRGTRPA